MKIDAASSAVAHPNIAFIKYWGNLDNDLRLPSNGSISMNLAGLETNTRVTYEDGLEADSLTINDHQITGQRLERVGTFLDLVRAMAGVRSHASVTSTNNFPVSAGIASSAAAFAALALAASRAAGLDLDEAALSRLARRGSGSACRSIPGGFVEWNKGTNDTDSYAVSIAPAGHWALADCIAIVSREAKSTGSTNGHAAAGTSPLQAARLADAPRRLEMCRKAILERDFEALARVAELDSDMMHAVMMTSDPSLVYWVPATLGIMQAVRNARNNGLAACYTIDAGPNVHVITEAVHAEQVTGLLTSMPEVLEVKKALPGGPARYCQP